MCQLHRNLLFVLLVPFINGCTESTSPPAEPLAQVELISWEDQIEMVRSGEADAVRSAETPITSGQWAMLKDVADSLRILEADYRRLTAEDLQLLGDLPNLERLKLTGPVDDAALWAIANASGLTVLNLPDGVFTDTGMKRLDSLQSLELLRFGSPHVTDAGLAVIPQLPSLRFLHLIDVPITDEGLEHLRGLSDLESFYLDGGRCTEQGLYELLRALPEVHFHRDQLHLPDDPRDHPHETAD